MGAPRSISIITAVLNRRDMLKQAIESALQQGQDGVQHIIQDGGSTDGTLEMLAQYPHLEIASTPDRNLYDAWNLGIARATGDVICILNSDDALPDGAFEIIRRAFAATPEADMVSGPVELVRMGEDRADGRLIGTPAMLELREQDIGPGVPLTNGRYITRRKMGEVGAFDTRYPAWSDRQFLLRLLFSGINNVTVSAPVYRYVIHDQSLTFNDAGPDLDHLLEACQISRDGMQEAADPQLRNAYRRWHAWACRYIVACAAMDGHPSTAFRAFVSGFKADAFWPLRATDVVLRHWRERHARRGVKIAER